MKKQVKKLSLSLTTDKIIALSKTQMKNAAGGQPTGFQCGTGNCD